MATPFSTTSSPLLSSCTGPLFPTMTLVDPPSSKPKKARCEHGDCRVKLGLLGFDCRCGLKFCATHRHPEIHSCTFDHKSLSKAQLEKTVIGCKADKFGGSKL